ncbi:MAG: SDR family oxidoreductase [Verrucomicrobiota bacterium]
MSDSDTIQLPGIKGKTALIFGVRNDASIAWATAESLHAQGCTVALNYLLDTQIEVETLAKKAGMDPELIQHVDVRDEAEIENFVKAVHQKAGKVDFIFHSVAYGNHRVMCSKAPGSQDEPTDFLDIPFEDFMDSFNISTFSLLRICKACRPFLNPGASVLAMTYNASQRVLPAYGGMAINKAALENLTQYLAHHLADTDIRVNALSAGLVMTTSAAGIAGVRKLRKLSRQVSPLGNVKARDVADAALYYFSDLSKKVTGNIHYIDGGINMMGTAGNEDT